MPAIVPRPKHLPRSVPLLALASLGVRTAQWSSIGFSPPVPRACNRFGTVTGTRFVGTRLIAFPFVREPFAGVAALAVSTSVALSLLGRRHRYTTSANLDSVRHTMEKSPIQTQVEEIIALQPVVIFSKTTCSFSAQAKAAFQKIGFKQIPTVELDKLEPSVANEIQDHMLSITGARTVPRVFIRRTCIGGGTETSRLGENGELKSLVDKALADHRKDLNGEFNAKVEKSEEEWRKELTPEQYRILRQRSTEPPGSHEYDQFYPETGYFSCGACDLPLYSASSKFRSSCGWPVFDKCYHSKDVGCHIGTRADGSGSLEILCPKCGSHLGHVFFDAHSPENPNGERH